MKLSDLIQDPANANKGTKRGNKAVADSLSRYGAGRSILIDKHGTIIAGNKTAANARAAGIEDVEVIQTDGTKIIAVQRIDLDLSQDAKAKELGIADNRASELGLEWNPEVLGQLATELDLQPFFTDAELTSLIGNSNESVDDVEVPELPAEAITSSGDVWVMGDHRLVCGDGTVITDVERLMDGAHADLCWTDPPYNVAYEGKTKDALTIQNDAMEAGAFRQLLTDAFVSMLTASKPGASIYVAHADLEGYAFRGAFRDAGWDLKQCLVWVKNAIVLGRSDYHWQHEPILYGWKPGAAHKWHSDRTQSTVLEFDKPSSSRLHPTMKPIALVAYCIENSSERGDIVLDLFGGSGTTLLACENTKRKCRMMELDPKYCDVIVARWEQATGKKAERVPNESSD
jgi:site-specific DNA-methyltransferase (adenine-specific)